MKLPQITAMYTGAVLGSGILVIPGILAESTGPASLLAWAIMALLTIPLSLTLGLLSAEYPNSGGVAHFATKAFSPRIGSLVGWYFSMAVIVGAPTLAITGAGYVVSAFGLGDTQQLWIATAILLTGLVVNFLGLSVAGWTQIFIVSITVAILIFTIAGNLFAIDPANFHPFMPNGWSSVGHGTTLVFWCFIGWEAVSNMSAEFANPRRDAVRGSVISSMVVGTIYFLTALIVVGTHSYGDRTSSTPLIAGFQRNFGATGAIVASACALFVCTAPAISYIGAAARMIQSLANDGFAPRALGYSARKCTSPAGALLFLAICFTALLASWSSGSFDIASMIELPSSAFILTYIAGAASGVRLFRRKTSGFAMSIVALATTVIILLFVRWSVVYALAITILWATYQRISKHPPRSRESHSERSRQHGLQHQGKNPQEKQTP